MPLVIDTYRTDDTILSLVEKKTLSLLSVHNGVHSAPCRWPARSPHCSWLTSSLRPSSVTGSGPASHFSAPVGFFFLTELRLSDEVRRVSLADGVQQREPDAERLPERRQRLDEPIDGHHRRGAAARLSRVPRPAHPQSTTAQHRSSTGLSISVYRSVLLFLLSLGFYCNSNFITSLFTFYLVLLGFTSVPQTWLYCSFFFLFSTFPPTFPSTFAE